MYTESKANMYEKVSKHVEQVGKCVLKVSQNVEK